MREAIVIAEAGCNHGGSMETAKEMIQAAKLAGANIIKFQKRTIDCIPDVVYDRPYLGPHSFGRTYGEHRKALEFSIEQHQELAQYCRETGIEYSVSVWDIEAAHDMAEHLSPDIIKIPSARNTLWNMIEYLRNQTAADIHISLGMTTADERQQIIDFVRNLSDRHRFALYHCTSAYPCPFKDLNLCNIRNLLSDCGQNYKIGFSGHHLGIAADVAAYVLGATYIERHFTLDRTAKGTDHAASLEPHGLSRLIRDLRAVNQAMQSNPGMAEVEKPMREKLKI